MGHFGQLWNVKLKTKSRLVARDTFDVSVILLHEASKAYA